MAQASFENITVQRTQSDQLTISWSSPKPLTKIHGYWSAFPSMQEAQPLSIDKQESSTIAFTDPSPGQRLYFLLHDGQEAQSSWISERSLPLHGTNNLRDLGGYPTIDGRRIQWNRLYRSDSLSSLTEADQTYLQQIGIQHIFDLRTEEERYAHPNQSIIGATYTHISAFSQMEKEGLSLDIDSILKQDQKLPSDPLQMIQHLYRSMLWGNPAIQQIVQQFAEGSTPILFHCTHGKDRTGFTAALLLLALGVPEPVVMEDYLLSNQQLASVYDHLLVRLAPLLQTAEKRELFSFAMKVRAEYLQFALDQIKHTAGGIEAYLEAEFNLDKQRLAALRDHYLTEQY